MLQTEFNNQGHSRDAGILLHITSLPGNYGIGELGAEAFRFVEQLHEMGFTVWQFLPIGPTGFGDSPYQSHSTFAGNEMLVDVQELVSLGLLQEDELADLASLPQQHVDYGALVPVKSRLLALAASRFGTSVDSRLQIDFDRFLDKHDAVWLHNYALYRVLKSTYGERPWPQWPSEFARRDELALGEFERVEAARIRSIKIIQFLFFRQWEALRSHAHGKGVRLLGDMPLYVALDSADSWADKGNLRINADGQPDCVAGVPPDYFSEDGQLWGNPLYDWSHQAASGYVWWIQRMRAVLELVDLVRIDHFRGFESYWAIPADAETARDGVWEAGPGGEVFDAMLDEIEDLPIVAEDLGIITPAVETLRDDYQLPGMTVLQFAVCDPNFQLSDVRENSVCYTGTHDNDTTVGWFYGNAGDGRSEQDILDLQENVLRITNGRAETVHTDLIRSALLTHAAIAMAPLQDYLGLGTVARMNKPGIAENNWQWRVDGEQLSAEFCANIASLLAATNRGRKRNGCKQ